MTSASYIVSENNLLSVSFDKCKFIFFLNQGKLKLSNKHV